jgi:glycosyltransferase involved in cell wall biosynthesis
MFASYGVPVIGMDHAPVNSLINDFSLGRVASTPEEFKEGIEEIIKNYKIYSKNAKKMLLKQNWKLSADVHSKVLSKL